MGRLCVPRTSEIVIANFRASLVVPGAIGAFTGTIRWDEIRFAKAVTKADVAHSTANTCLGILAAGEGGRIFDLVDAVAKRAT